MSDLKPCPFCGDKTPYTDEASCRIFGRRTGHHFAVACSNCEVSALGNGTMEDAIAAWNTRADLLNDPVAVHANMTAHKERAMGMAAMSDAPEQIWLGRDERYQGEPWIRLTSDFDEECETQEYIRADRIEQLVATNEALTKDRDAGAKDYCALMDRHDALFVRAEALEAKLAENEVRLRKAVEALDEAVKWVDRYRWAAPWVDDAHATIAEISSHNKGESHE